MFCVSAVSPSPKFQSHVANGAPFGTEVSVKLTSTYKLALSGLASNDAIGPRLIKTVIVVSCEQPNSEVTESVMSYAPSLGYW